MSSDPGSHDLDEHIRKELVACRESIASVRNRRKQELERATNCSLEDVPDLVGLFETLLSHPDDRIRCLSIDCSGDFATPDARLLRLLRAFILSGTLREAFSAALAIYRWYERSPDGYYLDYLNELQDLLGRTSDRGLLVDFVVGRHLPPNVIFRLEKLVTGNNRTSMRELEEVENVMMEAKVRHESNEALEKASKSIKEAQATLEGCRRAIKDAQETLEHRVKGHKEGQAP